MNKAANNSKIQKFIANTLKENFKNGQKVVIH